MALADQQSPAALAQPSFREALALWAKIGCLSFGGAAGQIAMLHRAVVDEKKWIEERRFLDALNFCTLLPGPEAQQLATYLGFMLHGVRGGFAAGLLFVVPGALVMLGLSFLYVLGRGIPLVDGLLFGIKAAVIAIVVEALLKIGKRAFKTRFLVWMAVLSFALLAFLKVPFPLVIGGAALIGAWLAVAKPDLLSLAVRPDAGQPSTSKATREAFMAAFVWLLIWWAPVLLAVLLLGPGHLLVELGLFFSKLAVITFGGAYAVLAYLAEAAVHSKGWVKAPEMIDGLGLAETTPGPTILVNQFVGFLAAWRNPAPFSPWLAATLGAIMTVWVTFAPSFVWIFGGAPFVERARSNKRIAGALALITAAVAGVIASLLLTFALGVLFGRVGIWQAGPLVLPIPDLTSLNVAAAGLALLAAFLLFRLHRGVVETVAVLAFAGVAVTMLPKML
ncbi:MAG: chromate efflux transporter [Bosea sp. (in: a-proteobacteria)]